MKILFLSDNFPPENNAPAIRTFEHCKTWVKKGYDVTVITCFPNFPTGKLFDGYSNSIYKKEKINGINVIRVWSFITSNSGFIRRSLDYISFGITSLISGLFIKSDVIIATSPQFFVPISGRIISKIKGIPWIMEVRDIWPESIVSVGVLDKKNYIIKFLEKIEIGLYKSASKIIVVTDSFKSIINNKGIDPKKIYVHKNGVLLEEFNKINKDMRLLNHLNLADKQVFGYFGTHGLAHGLSFILNCLNDLKFVLPNAHFLFMGDGAQKENLINLAKELNLFNVTFLPSVSRNDINRYLSIIDVSLINLRKSDTFLSVIPSKIFEAAYMEKPILLGLEGESKEIIYSYNAGLSFKPEDKDDFIKKCKLILDSKNYDKFKDGCKKLSKAFDRNKIALEMLKTILNS